MGKIYLVRGNPLMTLHGLLFQLAARDLLVYHPTDRIALSWTLIHQSWSTGWNVK